MSSNPDPLPGTHCHADQSSLASETEATTYNQAITSPNSNQWKIAIDEELTSREENNMWTLTELPDGSSTVKCR